MSHNCTNSTSYATQYEDWLQATQYWAWTLTAVGGVGNLLTILVILHQLYIGYSWKHRPRSSLRRQDSNSRFEKPVLPFEGHTLLLLHLSFCDLLYATVSIPLTAITYGYALDGATQELEGLCPVAAFLRYTNALAEWLTLGLLAFQRCVDLGRWRSARLFKSAATGFLIGGVWAVSVALQLVPFAVGGYGYSCENFKCDITNGVLKTIFYTIQSLLPCFMMFTGCVGLLYQLRKYTKEMENMKMVSNVSRKRLVKSSILVLSLLLLFLVCVVPICIHNLIPKDVVSPEVHIPAGLFLYKIYYLQYAINFMLYNIMSANFRSAYRRFFSLFFPSCCSPVGDSSTIYSVSASQSCRSDTQRETLSVCNQSDSIKTSTKF
ncbi:melatonin receptor type 1B-B-like [Penaeus vannamei]|uniref:melatonin receptor type 1B-B-like n=1 Tax=Penaeus vannamei TaxID=6689 RepID=UPI00387F643B